MKKLNTLPKIVATRLVVCGLKGGVGKSNTSAIFQCETDGCVMITNDSWAAHATIFNKEGSTVIKRLAPTEAIPEIPLHIPVVFDAGGYGDARLSQALESSDVAIVPTTTDPVSLKSMLTTLDQISKETDNIIIIVNKAKRGDLEGVKMVLESMTSHPEFQNYPVIELMESKLFSRCLNQGISITQQYNASGLSRHWFDKPFKQVAQLFDAINGFVIETEEAAA